jgi:hypothetical protein
MSDSDKERIVGKAALEYSAAKTTLAMLRGKFEELGETLKSIGEALLEKENFDHAIFLASRKIELVNAEELQRALQEFAETNARFLVSKKKLHDLGIAIDD